MAGIGQGAYGRGGLTGEAARTAQKGESSAGSYAWKRQDARSYLQGDDRLAYDNALAGLNKGYSGNWLEGPIGAGVTTSGNVSDKRQRELDRNRRSRTAYTHASSEMQRLRLQASEAARAGGNLTQGVGASRSSAGRGGAMPEEGGLFQALEIDQTWMEGKGYGGGWDGVTAGAGLGGYAGGAQKDLSKPWLWSDY